MKRISVFVLFMWLVLVIPHHYYHHMHTVPYPLKTVVNTTYAGEAGVLKWDNVSAGDTSDAKDCVLCLLLVGYDFIHPENSSISQPLCYRVSFHHAINVNHTDFGISIRSPPCYSQDS